MPKNKIPVIAIHNKDLIKTGNPVVPFSLGCTEVMK
jgi:hypothetical protein